MTAASISQRRIHRLSAALVAGALLASACGSDESDDAATATTDAPDTETTPATEEPAEEPTSTDAPEEEPAEESGEESGSTATTTAETDTTESPATTAPEGDAGMCASVDLSSPPDEPVSIRYGLVGSGEEPLALLWATPDAFPNNGSWYSLDTTEYNAVDRLTAYQAGEMDAGTFSFPALVTAVGRGLDLRGVASVVSVNEDDNQGAWAVLSDSGIASVADLEGARIGYLGPNTSTEYWMTSALVQAGVSPDSVTFVALPVPAQEEAMRNDSVDVAYLARQFLHIGTQKGGIDVLLRPYEAVGMDQPTLVISFDPGFIEEHPEAFCAWRNDYQQAMSEWLTNTEESVQALIAAEYLTPGAADAGPFPGRHPLGALVMSDLDATMADMAASGFMEEDLVQPAESLVIEGYSITE